MNNDIYYKRWGYDKTYYSFFKIIKQTDHYTTFQPLQKNIVNLTNQNGIVTTSGTQDGEPVKVHKSKMWKYNLWDGNPMEENYNYTYTGT